MILLVLLVVVLVASVVLNVVQYRHRPQPPDPSPVVSSVEPTYRSTLRSALDRPAIR